MSAVNGGLRMNITMDTTDELFCDLMDLPPSERIRTLEAMTSLSAEQKVTIFRMLDQVDSADAYFTGTSVAVKVLPQSCQVEGEGDMCGPYKLVRKLGEGGFGLVWLAEQENPLKRTVAVKVIKAGMDTAEVLARFDAEKHALSRMDHKNIAKVLDAGITELGRPYFTMELVEGKSITKYCQDHGISLTDRLQLFSDVCSALNHAHQKGVIHRDIKPSNVIVTEIESKPVVKVIDFGIAKAIEGNLTDHTLFTRVEQWIGTPAYMSPEQAGLASSDVDTRSDIYALGVLLYELIAGVAPFDSATLMKAGYEEMRRIIREVEPLRPSERIATTSGELTRSDGGTAVPKSHTVKAVSSELDWIVMKAMDKAKERRYESASALAIDVGHFLSDEPVEAKPPSTTYMLSKFARRHRRAVIMIVAISTTLIGAVVFSTWQAIRAKQAEDLAKDRLYEAISQRNAKDSALMDAEAVTRLLMELFKRPNPNIDGRKVTMVDALDAAIFKLDNQLINQPERHVMLLDVLAETFENLGLDESAISLKKKAVSIRSNHGIPTSRKNQFENEAVEYEGANSDLLRKQWNSAIVDYGETDERTIKAQCDYAISLSTNRRTRHRNSFEILKNAYEKSRTVLGKQHVLTTEVQVQLARMMHSRGMSEQAVKLHLELIESLRERDGPTAPSTLDEENGFIGIVRRQAMWSRTNHFRDFLLRSLELRLENLGAEHIQTSRIHVTLSSHYLFDHDYLSGLEHAERAIPALMREFGATHRNTAAAMELKAIHLAALGRLDDSLKVLNAIGPDSQDNIQLNSLLGVLQIWTKDVEGYNSTRRRMLQYLAEQCTKVENRTPGSIQNDLQRTSEVKYDIIEFMETRFSELFQMNVQSIVHLCCLLPLENNEQGVQLLESMELADKNWLGRSSPRLPVSLQASYLKLKAFVKYRSHDFAGAEEQLTNAERMLNTSPPNERSRESPSDIFLQAMIFQKLGKTTEAEQLFQRGQERLPTMDLENYPLKGMFLYYPLYPLPWILHQESQALIHSNAENTE